MGNKNIKTTTNIDLPNGGKVSANITDNAANISYQHNSEVQIGNLGTAENSASMEVGTDGVKASFETSYKTPAGATVNYDPGFWNHVYDCSPQSMISFGNILSSLPKGAKVNVLIDNGNIVIHGHDLSVSASVSAELDLTKGKLTNVFNDKKVNPSTGGSLSAEGKVETGYSVIQINDPEGTAFSGRVQFGAEGSVDFNLKRTLEELSHFLKSGDYTNRPLKIIPKGNAGVTIIGTWYEAPKFSFDGATNLSAFQQINKGEFGWNTKLSYGGSVDINKNGKLEGGEVKWGHWTFSGSMKDNKVVNPFDYICSTSQVAALNEIKWGLIQYAPIVVQKLDLRSTITVSDVLQAKRNSTDAAKDALLAATNSLKLIQH